MRARFVFALLILALGATPSFGQQTLLDEDFEDNKNDWCLQQDSNFRVAIENGVLHLEKFEKNFTSRGCLWYNKTIPGLNTQKNFTLTVYARFLRGGDVADMLDLQWGGCNQKEAGRLTASLNQLTFLFKGRVWLEHFDRRWTNRVDEDVASEKMAGFQPTQRNKFEIEQKDSLVIFRVNDKELFRQTYRPVAGNGIGMQQCLKSAWEIDRIVIRQDLANRTAAPDVVKVSASGKGQVLSGEVRLSRQQ